MILGTRVLQVERGGDDKTHSSSGDNHQSSMEHLQETGYGLLRCRMFASALLDPHEEKAEEQRSPFVRCRYYG